MNDQASLVGIVLIAVGILDPLLGVLLVGPRIPDPTRRKIVVGSLVGSGAILVVIGALVLGGVIPI
jgi:hypothetical protein